MTAEKPTPTHYETLGVPESASDVTIKEAFRSLVLLHHPDKQRTQKSTQRDDQEEMVQQIQTAYNVLRDTNQRQAYDQALRLARQRNVGRLESAIVVQRADCVVEHDQSDGAAMLVYACRCGALLDTSPLDDDSDEEDDGLLECPGCSLLYDVSRVHADESNV